MTKRVYHGHGSSRDPTWSVWSAMKQRCTNPRNKMFNRYGGRGITVCDRWSSSFTAFLEDMGQRPSRAHTIEREDNDAPYAPGNCRWATRREQNLNNSRTAQLEHDGQKFAGYDALAEKLGVTAAVLRSRADRGTLGRYGITRIN